MKRKGGAAAATLPKTKRTLQQCALPPTPFLFDPGQKTYRLDRAGWQASTRRLPPGPEGSLLLGDGGRVAYFPRFFHDAPALFDALRTEVHWRRQKIRLFGKEIMQPREISYMATDPSLSYTYSGLTLYPSSITPTVATIQSRVESLLDKRFNCVLLNHYRDGRDHMGWHSDNEALFGHEPVIASVSFGCPRAFDLRSNGDTRIRWRYMLGDGDVFVMDGGAVQRNWKHAVLVNKRIQGDRINLTFRTVQKPESMQRPNARSEGETRRLVKIL